MNIRPIKTALLSVANKAGLVEFAQSLIAAGVSLISTGGTSALLAEAKIPFRPVEDITGLGEMLDGRVKTLHPRIHGGILGRRDVHAEEALALGLEWIDLVVVNFYPFAEVIQDKNLSWDEAIEHIDVGGPTMVRAAAKNFNWVSVVTDLADYAAVISDLQQQGGLNLATRKKLAQKAFALTAHYDHVIHQYFIQTNDGEKEAPHHLALHYEKQTALRYGENPHQKACAYQAKQAKKGVLAAHQHQGKPLSYNNLLDADAAWSCVKEFSVPTCVIVKHANPCGAASADNIDEAYVNAFAADPISAFGGIIALNQSCTEKIAQAISQIFVEVILAPAYTAEALMCLQTKPNLRVLEMPTDHHDAWEMKFIHGGLLLQEKDPQILTVNDINIVTTHQPTPDHVNAMLFAWRVLKHIKSNGILIAKNNLTVGIGAGQVSRIDAVDLAIRKAGPGITNTILASDAFFPFRDSIDKIANTGVRAIIQPGGSMRDPEIIAACNEHGIPMGFTGIRCFRH